jgi:hypothetical protein
MMHHGVASRTSPPAIARSSPTLPVIKNVILIASKSIAKVVKTKISNATVQVRK